MAFTAADERVIRSGRFNYRPGPDGREAQERRTIDSANEQLPAVADQVCGALRGSFDLGEELRELVPMMSYRVKPRSIVVRYDVLACTDRQVHVVFAGTDTGVEVHRFVYGTLDADTKVLKAAPELTEKKGKRVLVVPRVAGKESRIDGLLSAPPAARNPKLATEEPAVPPGWHTDPTGRHQVRWWDGSAWTANAADGETTVHDPLP